MSDSKTRVKKRAKDNHKFIEILKLTA